MRYILPIFILLLAVPAISQVRPDQFFEETNPNNANFELYSQKSGAPRRATLANVKKYMVPFLTDTVNFIPAATGNTTNLGEFVWDEFGGLWYIDGEGDAISFNGGGPIYVTSDSTAQTTVYAPAHGLADTIALYGYVPVQADFTRANSSSADSVFIAYAVEAPHPDTLVLIFSGVLEYLTWHGKELNTQYYLQDDGSEDVAAGTVSMPTAIASDSTTLFLREVGVDIAGRLRRIAMPSPIITAFGGNPSSPTDAVVQAAIEGVYLPAGLAQPGTVFTLNYLTQSRNPTYQQTAPNTNPLTPSYAWLWDGAYATRIVTIPTSFDLQDNAYGTLGTLPLLPIDSLMAASVPTDDEVALWLDTNYTTNNIRIPNGSLLYFVGAGTEQNPDYIWHLIDDVSYDTADNDWERILKRVSEPATGDGNGLFDASNDGDTVRVSTALLRAGLTYTQGGNTTTFNSSSGVGVTGTSLTNSGGLFSSVSGAGIYASTNPTSANSYAFPIILARSTTGTASSGIGSAISFVMETSAGSTASPGYFGYKWSDAVSATRTSAFELYGVDNAITSLKLALSGSGQLTLPGYAANALNSVDSSLYVLASDATGDVWSIPVDSLGGGGGSDNLGDHTATQDLDMARYDITRVDTLDLFSGTRYYRLWANGVDDILYLSAGQYNTSDYIVSFDSLLGVRIGGTDGYNMPTADGTSGQVLTTDGAGQVSWGNTGGMAIYAADYGAQGDGATDDTKAIQEAIDTAYARGGGIVVLPAGTVIVSIDSSAQANSCIQIKEGVSLTGYGRDQTTLTRASADRGDNGILIVNAGYDTATVYNAAGNFTISHFTITDGGITPNRALGDLIGLGHAENVVIEHMGFGNHDQHAIDIASCNNITVRNNVAVNNVTASDACATFQVEVTVAAGIWGINTDGTATRNIFIHDNHVTNTGAANALHIFHGIATPNQIFSNIHVYNNYIDAGYEDNEDAIGTDDNMWTTIEGLRVYNNTIALNHAGANGINFLCERTTGNYSDVRITGNTITGSGKLGVLVGGSADSTGTFTNVTIENNTVNLDFDNVQSGVAGVYTYNATSVRLLSNYVYMVGDTLSINTPPTSLFTVNSGERVVVANNIARHDIIDIEDGFGPFVRFDSDSAQVYVTAWSNFFDTATAGTGDAFGVEQYSDTTIVFLPTSLDSLYYWFDATNTASISDSLGGSISDGEAISAWNDLSGNGYHLSAPADSMPVWSAMGGPNSQPAIAFNGTTDFMESAAHWWGADSVSVFIVAKFDNATRDANEILVGRSATSNRQFYFSGNNVADSLRMFEFTSQDGGAVNARSAKSTTAPFAVKSTDYRLYEFFRVPGDSDLFINASVQNFTQSPFGDGTIYNFSRPVTVGCVNDVSPVGFFDGSIIEIIVYAKKLTPTQRAQVEAYINAKHSIW